MRGVNAVVSAALIVGCSAPVRTTEVGHPERAPRGYEATPRRLANLKRIAARDLGCPLPGVLVSEVNWQVWRTEGCGRIEHYAITRRGRGRYSSARWHPMIHVSLRGRDALRCPSGVQAHERRLDRFEVVGCGHRAVMRLRCTLEGCGWFATAPPERVARQAASPPANGAAMNGAVANGTVASDTVPPPPPGEGAGALSVLRGPDPHHHSRPVEPGHGALLVRAGRPRTQRMPQSRPPWTRARGQRPRDPRGAVAPPGLGSPRRE